MDRTVTYSASVCIPLSRACANRCGYCGFRDPAAGLIGAAQAEAILRRGALEGATEVLLMSGEGLEDLARPSRELAERSYSSPVEFAYDVARRALKRGLLPHTNIGPMTEEELQRLKPVNASMGLMLENANEAFGRRVHPGKSVRARLDTITAAGRLAIPFTTGLLLGLGETQADRLQSLEVLAALQATYGHLQEIIFQPFVPNRLSTIARQRVPLADFAELVRVSLELMPGVTVQVPPNLTPHWLDVVRFGARDLGGLSTRPDLVNPGRPWKPAAWYGRLLAEAGWRLVRRLPVYPRFIEQGWVSPAVVEVIDHVERRLAS